MWKNGSLQQTILSFDEVDSSIGCQYTSVISQSHYNYSFNLYKPPLLRFYFTGSELLIQMHHIIYDHGCDDRLHQILTCLFNDKSLPEETVSFIDYTHYINTCPDALHDSRETFWESILDPIYAFETVIPCMSHARSGMATRVWWETDDKTSSNIHKIAKQYKTTVHNIVLSFFSVFLHQTYHPDPFYIGGNYHNRTHPDSISVLGYFMSYICYKSVYIPEESKEHTIRRWISHIQDVHKYKTMQSKASQKLLPKNKQLPYCSIVFTEVPFNPLSCLNTKYGNFQVSSLKESIGIQSAVFSLVNYLFSDRSLVSGLFELDRSVYDIDLINSLSQQWTVWLKKEVVNL
jgi:hypothetical protein